MLSLRPERINRVLCLGAHADDIEIGCGGTLLSLIRAVPGLHVEWVVFSGDERRSQEARQSAEAWLVGAGSSNIQLFSFSDTCFPEDWRAIKAAMQRLVSVAEPDLLLTHYLHDRHQDHRLLSELTWNAFRDHLILEYEIPKYDGDLGQPNLFVPLDGQLARSKLERLSTAFPSQAQRPWYDTRVFEGHLRLRGVECRAEFAEAFHCRKSCLTFNRLVPLRRS